MSAATTLAAVLRADPFTPPPGLRVARAHREPVRVTPGPVLGDALTGVAPTWREDYADAPIYQQLVAELGDPMPRRGRRAREETPC